MQGLWTYSVLRSPREGRDLSPAKKLCTIPESRDVLETPRLDVRKTAIMMNMRYLRRDESRLYERQHTGMDLYGECDNRDEYAIPETR